MRAVVGLLAFAVARSLTREQVRQAWEQRHSFLHSKQPVEQLREYSNHSLAVPLASPLVSVSAQEWSASLGRVLDAGESRNVFAADIEQVEGALKADLQGELTASGSVAEQEFSVSEHKAWNVVAKVPGTSKDGRFVLLGAHYDTLPAAGPAPGAEDNGSGVAALLAAAAKLAGQSAKRDMYFVLFSAEEQGLLGSHHFVEELTKSGALANLDGAIILDEVAYARDRASRQLIFETSGDTDGNNRVLDTLASVAQATAPDVSYEVNYDGFGSDHMPFLEQNRPAVLVIERDNMYFASQWGHSSEDTADKVVPELGASVATIASNALRSLANA